MKTDKYNTSKEMDDPASHSYQLFQEGMALDYEEIPRKNKQRTKKTNKTQYSNCLKIVR